MRSNSQSTMHKDFTPKSKKAAMGFDLVDLPLPVLSPWWNTNIIDDLSPEKGFSNYEFPEIFVKEEQEKWTQKHEPIKFPLTPIKKEPGIKREKVDQTPGFSKIMMKEELGRQEDHPVMAWWIEEQLAFETYRITGGKWQCIYCAKQFKRKSTLKSHIKRYSEKKKTLFQCTTCFRAFPWKSSLVRHLRVHNGEKPFKCEICKNTFREKYSLARHLQLHTGEKPFKCLFCQRTFSRKSHLQSHSRIHTGDSPKMRLSCVHCSKSFNSKSRLTVHLRSHTGERPYMCSHCFRRFAYKGNLTRHIRSHSAIGRKPYKCSICSKAYSRNAILRSHVQKVHGLEPYVCSKCGKSFVLKKMLDRHLGLCKVQISAGISTIS